MDKPTPPKPFTYVKRAATEMPLVFLSEAIAHGEAMAAWGAAQYKEDAERYRWLRDTNLDAGVRATGEHLEPLQVPMIFIGHPEDQWTLGSFASAWVGEKFDRAIDAAIDKARKGDRL